MEKVVMRWLILAKICRSCRTDLHPLHTLHTVFIGCVLIKNIYYFSHTDMKTNA